MKSTVIVIGAGIAGLSAAYTLSKRGIPVKVLEASRRVGGRMSTDILDCYVIDRGAQFLSSEYPLLLSYVRELGLDVSLRETSQVNGVVRDGKVRKARTGNALDALASGLLSLNDWMKLGWQFGSRRNQLLSLPLNDYSQWEPFDTETAARWCTRAVSATATDYFLEPMLQGLYFQSPEEVSKSLAFAVAAFGMGGGKTLTLAGGIGCLPEALAARLDVTLDARVTSLEIGDTGVVVEAGDRRYRAEYVVLATTASVAGTLYPKATMHERALLATPYSSNITIALMLPCGTPLPDPLGDVYGLLIPRREREVIAAVGIEANKCRDRAKGGQLLHVMLCGEASRRMLSLPDAGIVGNSLPELERYFPGVSDLVSSYRVYRWPEAEPLSAVGRATDIARYRAWGEAARRRVILAGDYMSMPFTEGAAESGAWAGELIHSFC